MNDAPVNDAFALLPLILNASLLVQAVMAFLLLLSFIGWLLIFRLSIVLSGAMRDDKSFAAWFWDGNSLPALHQALSHDNAKTGLARVFFAAFNHYKDLAKLTTHQADINSALERSLRVSLGKQQGFLEQGLATLASIASVSPYIGLFGTVWGIMNAFIGLSDTESASLSTVAPGIAEALIATAMGLFAAIPASLAYNHFSNKANNVYEQRALFCDQLLGAIERQHLHRPIAHS